MYIFKILKNKRGVTLVEILIGISLVSMLVMSIYLMLASAVKNMGDSKQRVGAVNIANEKMEIIRNLSYDEVGIIDGIVEGPLAASETVSRNGFNYIVTTEVRYVDDSFDGVAPADTVNTDYKHVSIEVSWQNSGVSRSVKFFSKFVPSGIETNVGGGTLMVNVMDSNGQPLADASVLVDSVDDSPSVYVSTTTDGAGNLTLPGTQPQEYRITVGKENYETVTTYPNPPGSTFAPIDSDVNVTEGGLVVKNFDINLSADMTIKAVNIADSTGIQGMEFRLLGGRKIGNSPDTYNYDQTKTTNASGDISLIDVSPGTYEVTNLSTLGNSQFAYVGADTILPLALAAGENKTVNFIFADKTKDSLLVSLKDRETSNPVSGAEVHVTSAAGFDQTVTTGADGRAYFPVTTDPPIEMEEGDYSLSITATGYDSHTETVAIDQLVQKEIQMQAQ